MPSHTSKALIWFKDLLPSGLRGKTERTIKNRKIDSRSGKKSFFASVKTFFKEAKKI